LVADATDGVRLLWDGTGIMGSWIDRELAGCEFADARPGKRFGVWNRASPGLPARLLFTDVEMKLLEHIVPTSGGSARLNVGRFLMLLARLGGSLNRNRHAAPGNMVLWPGMARLTDIHLGYCLARDVGN
jgi:hypothetical protein